MSIRPDRRRALLAWMRHWIAAGIPGLSVAVADDDAEPWTAALFGEAGGAPGCVSERSLFGIGSISKTFVAVLVWQLVEAGRIDLQASIGSLLDAGDTRGIANAATASVSHLLAHAGGIASYEDQPSWYRRARGCDIDFARAWDERESLRDVVGVAPLFAPGHGYGYSNSGYALLGLLVERITGRSLAANLRERIAGPLGLSDVFLEGFEPVPERRRAPRFHHATADFVHAAGISPRFPIVAPGVIDVGASDLACEWAAGGMVATARDLALFGRALRDGQLVAPTTLARMMRWSPAEGTTEVGRGLFREHPCGRALIGHDGDVLGSSASLFWIEGGRRVVSLLCNIGSMHAGRAVPVAYRIAKAAPFLDLICD